MKQLLFYYSYPTSEPCINLGDYIQTLAVRNVLAKLGLLSDTIYFDRDSTRIYHGAKAACVMQGWFAHKNDFVPNENIVPVYIGYHIDPKIHYVFKNSSVVEHFKKQPSIGCRDRSTEEYLSSLGIANAYFSRCLTLAFDKREKAPSKEKVFIVGVPERLLSLIPKEFLDAAEFVNQQFVDHREHLFEYEKLEAAAQGLLDLYKEQATLVITSALHVASPCTAMGIPVVMISPNPSNIYFEGRFSLLDDIIPIYSLRDLKAGTIEWSPTVPDIEDLKALLLRNVELSWHEALGEPVDILELEQIRNGIMARKFDFSHLVFSKHAVGDECPAFLSLLHDNLRYLKQWLKSFRKIGEWFFKLELRKCHVFVRLFGFVFINKRDE